MGKIQEKDLIKILSEDKKVRLDIGGDCVLKEVPASHESWATRLIIKRVDGPSHGDIETDHVVGIFSEDGQTRLDVGERAMKKNGSPSHESWATRLYIRRLNGGKGYLKYDELVGIFSENNDKRLDIGGDAMKEEVPASHESWATRLFIKKID